MPNDSLLGKYREKFLDQLAMIEEYPTKLDGAPGFAGAIDLIDSEDLIPLLDSSHSHRVDDRAFLAARLTDFILGDTDRHLGNWKWARLVGAEDEAKGLDLSQHAELAYAATREYRMLDAQGGHGVRPPAEVATPASATARTPVSPGSPTKD